MRANQSHGIRRTNTDKQRAVRAALLHPKCAAMSDNQLAEHVGVSVTFVGKCRHELEESGSLSTVDSRTGKDGRTIDTTNIGRKPSVEVDAEGIDRKPPRVGSPRGSKPAEGYGNSRYL